MRLTHKVVLDLDTLTPRSRKALMRQIRRRKLTAKKYDPYAPFLALAIGALIGEAFDNSQANARGSNNPGNARESSARKRRESRDARSRRGFAAPLSA